MEESHKSTERLQLELDRTAPLLSTTTTTTRVAGGQQHGDVQQQQQQAAPPRHAAISSNRKKIEMIRNNVDVITTTATTATVNRVKVDGLKKKISDPQKHLLHPETVKAVFQYKTKIQW